MQKNSSNRATSGNGQLYRRALGLLVTMLVLLPLIPASQPLAKPSQAVTTADQSQKERIEMAYGKLPLSFEPNQGQAQRDAKFLSRVNGYELLLGEQALTFALNSAKPEAAPFTPPPTNPAPPAILKMTWRGGNASPMIEGLDELPGKSNYFMTQSQFTDIANYGRVRYRAVYPGVDLVLYGSHQQLEYDFVVAPGANPGIIQLDFEGADKIELNPVGDLVLSTVNGQLVQHAPQIYQEINGTKKPVSGQYQLKANAQAGPVVGFAVGNYDQSLPLVIDPVLSYSTYLGDPSDDVANAIAVDKDGNAYVTGATQANSPSYGSFVVKLNPTGTTALYTTYAYANIAFGIVVDSAGSAYIVGDAKGGYIPQGTPGYDITPNGSYDVTVTKLSPAGNSIVYATFLGGSDQDLAFGIALDKDGNAYVTGQTLSTDFPLQNPLPAAYRYGSYDAFVTKINPTGTALVYSTYLGTIDNDFGTSIAVDSTGSAYVAGVTFSDKFPTTSGVFAPNFGGGQADGFVVKLTPSGDSVVYSTYLGGNDQDVAYSLAVDSGGNAYVSGWTKSTNFPVQAALQTTFSGYGDAFVTKINPTASGLIYSTYFGSDAGVSVRGITVDSGGYVYLTGSGGGYNFPPGTTNTNYTSGVFVSRLNPAGSAIIFTNWVSGFTSDFPNGIALDPFGNIYIAGLTTNAGMATTGAYKTTRGGNTDAFVAKIKAVGSFSAAPNAGSTLDFGTVATGDNTSLNIAITAGNTEPLAISLTGGSLATALTGANAGDFTIVTPAAFPLLVYNGNAATNITIRCQPSATGTRTAVLSLTTNDPAHPTVTYNLTCKGASNPLPPVTIAPATLPAGTIGAAYSQQLTASGGTGTGFSFAITNGGLPNGVTLSNSGLLSGTPSGNSGTFNFTVTATDSGNNTGSKAYSFVITPTPQPKFSSNPGTGAGLNFGRVPIGTNAATTITIANRGTADLTLSAPTGLTAPFSSSPTTAMTIAPNTTQQVTVNCNPTKIGRYSGKLSFTTNDPTLPNVSFDLRCNARPPKNTSLFKPLPPGRLYDSRAGTNAPLGGDGVITLGQVRVITIGGKLNIPATATALIANITVTNAQNGGFITAFPGDSSDSDTATINWYGTGARTVGNFAVIGLDSQGRFKLKGGGTADVIIDVVGYLEEDTEEGGISKTLPAGVNPRLYDSRPIGASNGLLGSGEGRLLNGQTRTIQVAGQGSRQNIPASATAVLVNLTAVATSKGGFLTLYPAEGTLPNVATVNWNDKNNTTFSNISGTVGNFAVVPLSSDGKLNITAGGNAPDSGADVVIDVVGYIDNANDSDTGFYSKLTSPARLYDTRDTNGTYKDANPASGVLSAGETRLIKASGLVGVPANAKAVVLRLTTVDAADGGFLALYPGTTWPKNASVNTSRGGQVIGNLAVIELNNGSFTLFNGGNAACGVVLDVIGYIL